MKRTLTWLIAASLLGIATGSEITVTVNAIALGTSKFDADRVQSQWARAPHAMPDGSIYYFEGPTSIEARNIGPSVVLNAGCVSEVTGSSLEVGSEKVVAGETLGKLQRVLGAPDRKWTSPEKHSVAYAVFRKKHLAVSYAPEPDELKSGILEFHLTADETALSSEF